MDLILGPSLVFLAIGVLAYARFRGLPSLGENLDFVVVPSAVMALFAFGVAFTISGLLG